MVGRGLPFVPQETAHRSLGGPPSPGILRVHTVPAESKTWPRATLPRKKLGVLSDLRTYTGVRQALGSIPFENLMSALALRREAAQSGEKAHGCGGGALATPGKTLKLTPDSLCAHKLRSFLTLLDVILAVATLVLVVSVVAGWERACG